MIASVHVFSFAVATIFVSSYASLPPRLNSQQQNYNYHKSLHLQIGILLHKNNESITLYLIIQYLLIPASLNMLIFNKLIITVPNLKQYRDCMSRAHQISTSPGYQKSLVSLQAFVQQLENWEMTLLREQKKLRTLRTKITSKMLANQLQIILTEIEGELIRYRKLKDPNKLEKIDVILEYNERSKGFMDAMEAIGNFGEKIQDINDIEQAHSDTLQLDEVVLPNNTSTNKKYQTETFTYSISKQPKHKYPPVSPMVPSSSKPTTSKKQSFNSTSNNINKNSNPSKLNKSMTTFMQSRNPPTSSGGDSTILKASPAITNNECIDAWQIGYQLKEIKSLMSQIKTEIKYHNHEDIELELSKLQHNNKKMSLELKSLKEDSQYTTSRIQKLKEELSMEKEVQAQMIREFQGRGRKGKDGGVDSRGSIKKNKSYSASVEHSKSRKRKDDDITQVDAQVSDWVRVRI